MRMPGLCSVCESCFLRHEGLLQAPDEGDLEPKWFFKAHLNFQSLATSRNHGCTICSLLWSRLSKEQIISLSTLESSEMLTFLMVFKDEALQALGIAMEEGWFLTMSFWELPDEWPGEKPNCEFILEPAAGAMLNYLQGPVSNSTSSETTWQVALDWIEKCRTCHRDFCSAVQIGQWHPTRLLDVGKEEGDHIRLLETSTIAPPPFKYVTLSHCWGTAQVFKLTKATAAELHQGISPVRLPLTFQHAILVTRKLQRRYLWIDSLCIYQDKHDKSDWLKEAPLMHKVYTNGEFNIAATGARDGSAGLFSTRVPDIELHPTKVSWLQGDYILLDWKLFERELSSAPLNQRGWVVQERLLAPRILHFGHKQLFWECNEGTLCERFPIRLPSAMKPTARVTFHHLGKLYRRPKRQSIVGQSIITNSNNPESSYILWNDIVRLYSRTFVTFSSDKLMALSGIAKVVRRTLDDEYVVGMWRRYLASHLLWSIDDTSQLDGSPSSRDFPYRAPTWSWLSVDGEVNFHATQISGLSIEVVSVEVLHSTADTTGPILAGILTLRGRLRPLQLRKSFTRVSEMGSELLRKAEAKGFSVDELMTEIPGQWTMSIGGKDLCLFDESSEEWLQPLVSLDVPSPNFDASNSCQELFIMSAGGPYTEPVRFNFHEMLILKCIDKDAGRFHRMGLATLDLDTQDEIFDMVKELDDTESTFPCVTYDTENHLHTIILE